MGRCSRQRRIRGSSWARPCGPARLYESLVLTVFETYAERQDDAPGTTQQGTDRVWCQVGQPSRVAHHGGLSQLPTSAHQHRQREGQQQATPAGAHHGKERQRGAGRNVRRLVNREGQGGDREIPLEVERLSAHRRPSRQADAEQCRSNERKPTKQCFVRREHGFLGSRLRVRGPSVAAQRGAPPPKTEGYRGHRNPFRPRLPISNDFCAAPAYNPGLLKN